MLHFIAKVLEHLQPYIPLMQSLVWPIVIIVAVVFFRSHVRFCIDAIRKRIEQGGGIKAGPFELPPMAPTTPQEQVKKLQDEASEEDAGQTTSQETPPTLPSGLKTQRDFMASYVLAEDLVMKKLSAELNLKIVRQVKAELGVRYVFDGVAVDENKFIAIEVKMLRRALNAKMIARQTLDRLNTFYTSLPEDEKIKFGLILGIVIEEGNPEDVLKQMSFVRETYKYPVHILCYRFTALQEEFGIGQPNQAL